MINIAFHRSSFVLVAAVLCAAVLAIAPRTAHAQDAPPKTTRVALLSVPGGGTKKLTDAIGSIDHVEVKGQGWFLDQIKSRGFQAKGIMKRSDDIKWLMKGAKISYIVYLIAKSDTAYEARVVGPKTGKVVHTFSIDRTPEGLSDAGARMAKHDFAQFLDKQLHPVDPAAEKRKREKEKARLAKLKREKDPNEVKKKAASAKNAAKQAYSKDWLMVTVGASGLRRDLHVASGVDTNQAVLAYTSAFYPGIDLGVEMFPIGMSNPDYASVGFFADYTHGFDSVTVQNSDNTKDNVSITHMDLRAGVMYQLGDALKLKTSKEAHFDLKVGVRYTGFSAVDNVALPSTSHTSLLIGARVTRQAFSNNFKVRAGVQIEPIGVYGTGATLFGESAHTYGFGGNLGGMFNATDNIGFTLGYSFELERTVFTGTGQADFVDANAFELVQGFNGGLFYQY